jgi:phage terminase large subunit-like protein
MNASAMTRGERVCAFIEKYLTAPEGDHVGKPIKLEAFQRKFILDIYDNPYVTHTAYLSIARKNGKSALIAGILLAHLCGPEAVQNSQIVTGARSKEQAALIFKLARKMVEASEILSKLVRVQPSGKRLIGLRKNVEFWPSSTRPGRCPGPPTHSSTPSFPRRAPTATRFSSPSRRRRPPMPTCSPHGSTAWTTRAS